jgi:hypothetical protein
VVVTALVAVAFQHRLNTCSRDFNTIKQAMRSEHRSTKLKPTK